MCSLSGWPDESEHAKHRLCGDTFVVKLWNRHAQWSTWTVPIRWGRSTQGRTAFLLPGVQVCCRMLSQEPLDETWLEKSGLYVTERHAESVLELMQRARVKFYRKLRGTRLEGGGEHGVDRFWYTLC